MLAVMLLQTLELYGLPDNWQKVAPFYLEALADVPADLVARGLKAVRMTCKWFPKPSELRQAMPDELSERRLVLARLRVARLGSAEPNPRPKKPLTAEQVAELDAIKASLAPTKPRKHPGAEPRRPLGKIHTAPLPDADDPKAQEWLERMGAR
jgi:hypothetical protein